MTPFTTAIGLCGISFVRDDYSYELWTLYDEITHFLNNYIHEIYELYVRSVMQRYTVSMSVKLARMCRFPWEQGQPIID